MVEGSVQPGSQVLSKSEGLHWPSLALEMGTGHGKSEKLLNWTNHALSKDFWKRLTDRFSWPRKALFRPLSTERYCRQHSRVVPRCSGNTCGLCPVALLVPCSTGTRIHGPQTLPHSSGAGMPLLKAQKALLSWLEFPCLFPELLLWGAEWVFLYLVLIQVLLTSAPKNVGIWGHRGPVTYLRYRVACICFLVELWTSPHNFSYGINPMLINHFPNQIETITHFQDPGSDLSPTRQGSAVEPIDMPSPSDNPSVCLAPLIQSQR